MSKKSNSKPQNNNENTDLSPEDKDFWNIENDTAKIDTPPEELEEIDRILAKKTLNQTLTPLSRQDPVSEEPGEEDVINSLDQHKGSKQVEDFTDLSSKNVDELLATATAEVMVDQGSNKATTATTKSRTKKEAKKTKNIRTTTEKAATLFCYLAIIGTFTYLVMYASKQHNFEPEKTHTANTPAEGQFANIEKVETWWSEPVGNNTKFGIDLVPSATITLGSSSTSGVIRSVFYSSEEGLLGQLRPKGDPFTHQFADGKFLESGTNQVTIHGSDGFKELAHFMFYRSQTETRWTLDIKEAPSITTKLNSFEPLATAPIDPLRK